MSDYQTSSSQQNARIEVENQLNAPLNRTLVPALYDLHLEMQFKTNNDETKTGIGSLNTMAEHTNYGKIQTNLDHNVAVADVVIVMVVMY